MEFVLMLAIYVFACYVNYRIVHKFDPSVSYGENLIPIYNEYLVAKQVMDHPGRFILILFFVPILFGIISHMFDTTVLASLGNIIAAVMTARLWGLIAEGLGKNFWLHAILAFFALPLLITVLIFAFDSSAPVRTAKDFQSPPPPPSDPLE